MKLLNDDARSTTGFSEPKDNYHRSGAWHHKKLGTRRNKLVKGLSMGDDRKKNKAVLDPIEERKNDDNEECDDHNSHDHEQSPIQKHPRKSSRKEKEESSDS